MTVVGFNITSLEANKDSSVEMVDVSVSSAPNIHSITEVDIAALGKKVLQIEFDLATTYTPRVGLIKIKGFLLFAPKDNAKTLESWNKNKSVPSEESVEILNFIFRRCMIKMINIADDLQLPPPISLPIVKLKPDSPQESKKKS